MGQIAAKLKKLFSELKWKPKTSVNEAAKETEVKSSADDQVVDLSQEVNELLQKTADEELKELDFAEKCVATDFDYSDDRYLLIEDYNKEVASFQKTIEAQSEVIQEHNSQLAAIEKILQTQISQENVKVSDEHQKTAEREENGFVVHSEEEEGQIDDSQGHKELHAIKDLLEEHQTKIEIIREMLDDDQGVYRRGRKVQKQLDAQDERLNNQEQSIEDMKAELRKELRCQKLQLDKVTVSIVVCVIIMLIIIALIQL